MSNASPIRACTVFPLLNCDKVERFGQRRAKMPDGIFLPIARMAHLRVSVRGRLRYNLLVEALLFLRLGDQASDKLARTAAARTMLPSLTRLPRASGGPHPGWTGGHRRPRHNSRRRLVSLNLPRWMGSR